MAEVLPAVAAAVENGSINIQNNERDDDGGGGGSSNSSLPAAGNGGDDGDDGDDGDNGDNGDDGDDNNGSIVYCLVYQYCARKNPMCIIPPTP